MVSDSEAFKSGLKTALSDERQQQGRGAFLSRYENIMCADDSTGGAFGLPFQRQQHSREPRQPLYTRSQRVEAGDAVSNGTT